MITDPRMDNIEKQQWTYNHMLKLLYCSRKANITLIDVGDYIYHNSIELSLEEMDLILIIVDPMPGEVISNYKN